MKGLVYLFIYLFHESLNVLRKENHCRTKFCARFEFEKRNPNSLKYFKIIAVNLSTEDTSIIISARQKLKLCKRLPEKREKI